MRWVIPCAGMATRWGDDQRAKQLLVVSDGEPLLARTLRQIHARDDSADVVVVTRPEQRWHDMIARWGGRVAVADRRENRFQADKLASSAHLWDPAGRTNVLWGDVWWSDVALDMVVAATAPWQAMLRFGPSQFTGCDHGEFFGFTFVPSEQRRLRAAVERTVSLASVGTLHDWSGGWQLLMAAADAEDDLLCGQNVLAILAQRYAQFVIEIDDFTDDFDYPADVDLWQKAYRTFHQQGS